MKVLTFVSLMGIIGLLGCSGSGTSKSGNSKDQVAKSVDVEAPTKDEQKVTTGAVATTVSQTPKLKTGQSLITFDQITTQEIEAHNSSHDGNNVKKPLEFEENGMKIKLSSAFSIKRPYGKQMPFSSPPNSLTAVIAIMKINDGASFNLDKLMLGCEIAGGKVKLTGTKGGEEKYVRNLVIDHTILKEYELDFEDIDVFIIWGGPGRAAVVDDLVISL